MIRSQQLSKLSRIVGSGATASDAKVTLKVIFLAESLEAGR